MLTLTAPGDRLHHLPDGSACPCTPDGGVDLAAWNASCSRRWNHVLLLLRRAYGSDLAFFRGVEVQDGKRRADGSGRGALHLHVLVWSASPLILRHVRHLAVTCGFGHSVGLDHCPQGDPSGSARFARYVSKYVTKSSDARALVPWLADQLDVATGELVETRQARASYRTWSCSRGWGFSMRQQADEIARANAWRAARAALVSAGLVPAGALDVVLEEPEPAPSGDPP